MSETNSIQPTRGRGVATRLAHLMKKASSLAQTGKYDEAIASVEEAMAICPQDPRCSVQLASIYKAQNRIGLAIEAMHRAVELDPLDCTTQEQLLQVLIELGRYDEAIDTSRKILRKCPKSIFARDVMGIAYLQQGKIDSALAVTNELIRIAPGDSAHHFKKAVLLQQKGEIAQSMAAFTRALDMDPDGEMADDAREAIAALDSYQLRQILTIAVEDVVFRAKLSLDPESAAMERGFYLSSSGISALRQIDLDCLPGDAQNRYYH